MQPNEINLIIKTKVINLAKALINQEKAPIIISPQKNETGFWFGGGNMIMDTNKRFILAGRYRNFGDSRTGIKIGDRGLELAIFTSTDFFGKFEKIKSFSKLDLGVDNKKVVSIEGVSLHSLNGKIELPISTEKNIPYPENISSFQKPGTGVWSIDLISADTPEAFDTSHIHCILDSQTPAVLHVKDPFTFDTKTGDTALIYCSHPHTWSSSISGLAVRKKGADDFVRVTESVLHRGNVWDVAITRLTDRFPVPRLGVLKYLPPISLYFYDGGECVRQLDDNPKVGKRPRGYSCEEIGGLAWGLDTDFPHIERLSVNSQLFISPKGTGCSRYVSTFVTDDSVYATWQQSQDDLSQPLVGHKLPMEAIEDILKE